MLVGFIAVIVILLVIVALFSGSGTSAKDSGARYITEAKKVGAMLYHMKNESQFYYSRAESYNGIGMDYFSDIEFQRDLMVQTDPNGPMLKADWENWPSLTVFPDNYTGPYIELVGAGASEMRIIVAPLNSGKNMGIYIMKKIWANPSDTKLDPIFPQILEKVLSSDPDYIGG